MSIAKCTCQCCQKAEAFSAVGAALMRSENASNAQLTRERRAREVLERALEHINGKNHTCEGCTLPDISLFEHYDYIVDQALAEAERIICSSP